ncbi:MAG: hypothetical protein IT555_01355 [Acetobacteraceae bacterium]|nr:hypothetical protein [Acetobacteraceae bacterium]
MSAHTPGPWVAVRNSSYWQINTEDFLAFGQIGDACSSGVWDYEGCPRTQEQAEAIAEANARLISAAPDLLAALEGVVSAYGDTTWGTVYAMERALPAARAAIAKAKGGSS